jgi:hypothetical protein
MPVRALLTVWRGTDDVGKGVPPSSLLEYSDISVQGSGEPSLQVLNPGCMRLANPSYNDERVRNGVRNV